MIKFSNVYKRYPGEMDALHDISLEINSADLVFVTGPFATNFESHLVVDRNIC